MAKMSCGHTFEHTVYREKTTYVLADKNNYTIVRSQFLGRVKKIFYLYKAMVLVLYAIYVKYEYVEFSGKGK
jgi:hypothetical protein